MIQVESQVWRILICSEKGFITGPGTFHGTELFSACRALVNTSVPFLVWMRVMSIVIFDVSFIMITLQPDGAGGKKTRN